MKKRALVVVMLCVMGLAAFSVGTAEAVPANWYQITIQQCGTGPGYYYLAASDAGGSFGSQSFFLDQSGGLAKEMLATGLTAVSNGGNAWAYINGTTVFAVFTR
jgi:hypothetical protein